MKTKRTILIVIVLLLAIGVVGGCGTKKEKKPLPSTKFMKSFNSRYSTSITNTVKFKPEDEDSDYYRVEYRLPAYEGSNGIHGAIGKNTSIDMVNYNYSNSIPNSFCIYVSGPENEIFEMFPALAKSINPKLTNEDIQSGINEYNKDKSLMSNPDVRDVLVSSNSNKGKQKISSDYIIDYGDHVEGFINSNITGLNK